MNNNAGMEQRLWDYIDGLSAADEKGLVEQLLREDAGWKMKYQELLEVNKLLHTSELDAPSLRFTKNVMEEVARISVATSKKYLNGRIIWGIGLFFILMLAGTLVYAIAAAGTTGGDSSKSITDKLPSFDFSRIFNNTWINVLLMINVVLGLFLLDAYLGRKRDQYQKEA